MAREKTKAKCLEPAEAELAVLGAILLDADAGTRMGDLEPGDFSDHRARALARAIWDTAIKGEPVDYALAETLARRTGVLDQIGGVAWIASLTDHCPSAVRVGEYARQVRDAAEARRLRASLEGALRALDGGEELRGVADSVGRAVQGASSRTQALERCSMGQFLEHLEQVADGKIPARLACGLEGVDQWAPRCGQLVVVAADSGCGKTALTLDIAGRIGARGGRVLYLSMEMTALEVQGRRVAGAARVDSEHLMECRMGEAEWGRVATACDALDKSRLDVVGCRGLTSPAISSIIRAEHARDPIVASVVDYLGLVRLPGEKRHDLEIGDVCREQADTAKACGIVCYCVCQLNRNRGSAQGKDDAPRRPRVADLRDSGEIEHTADVIYLLYREGQFTGGGDEQIVDLICGKRRGGRIGSSTLLFDMSHQSFKDAPPAAQKDTKVFGYDD